jgi:lauroyl/myristoyl acyltransferase
MTLCALRNRCWSQMLSLPDTRSIQVRCANPKRAQALRDRQGPSILTFWHLGASFMVSIGLQRIGVTGTVIARNPPPPWYRRVVSAQTKMVVISNDPRKATMALKMALDELRQGGVVVLALDGSQGQKDFTVPFLGRRIQLSRGIAALSRLTGAPIIPCGVTWGEKDWSLDFRLFEPVALPAPGSAPPEEWEKQVLTAAAARFEEIIRAFPGQTRLERLSDLAEAPRA